MNVIRKLVMGFADDVIYYKDREWLFFGMVFGVAIIGAFDLANGKYLSTVIVETLVVLVCIGFLHIKKMRKKAGVVCHELH